MPKGYWIAHVDVTDPEAYQKYIKANGGGVRQIWRALPGADRKARRHDGRGAVAPCRDRVPRL